MEIVRCKRCLSLVSEININRAEQVAHCERCGALFSLAKIYDTSLEPESKHIRNYKSLKPEVYEIPKGLNVMHHGFELFIQSKSGTATKIFLTLFSLFWNGVVSIFVLVALFTGEFTILLFISLHLAIGLIMGYYTLSLYLNKNEIIVDKRSLRTKHGPLKFPFKKEHYIESNLINQIYCQKYVVATVNGQPRYGYKVVLRKNDGEVLDILKGLEVYHQALYLEQQIESYLNLEDKNVEEEYLMD
jgi:hypothetical protein